VFGCFFVVLFRYSVRLGWFAFFVVFGSVVEVLVLCESFFFVFVVFFVGCCFCVCVDLRVFYFSCCFLVFCLLVVLVWMCLLEVFLFELGVVAFFLVSGFFWIWWFCFFV